MLRRLDSCRNVATAERRIARRAAYGLRLDTRHFRRVPAETFDPLPYFHN